MKAIRRSPARSLLRIVVSVVAMLALAAASALAVVTSDSYRGRTSQGKIASLRVSQGVIHNFVMRWLARCTMTHQTVTNTTIFHALVLDGSRFKANGRSLASVAKGYSSHFVTSSRGAFSTTSVRGTFAGTMKVYRDSSHTLVDVCQSGTFSFVLTG
ncbi:MAG: hypothetical protein WCB67_09960 [Solirubrobacteraceae bacterium]